jgi:hypothetical protein
MGNGLTPIQADDISNIERNRKRGVVSVDGISDTNTEQQILLSIDALAEDVRSLRTESKRRFDRLESDVKEIKGRFDGVESDIREIKETLLQMNGRR